MRGDRKRLVSTVITAALILGALLLAPSSAAGISVTVSPSASGFVVGQTINFSGSVSLGDAEFNRLTSVDLVIAGPQGCTAELPLNTDPYSTTAIVDQVVSCSPSGSGDLTVDVTYSGISVVDGYGYGYGYGDGLLGSGSSASVAFNIDWSPPAFLDPAPLFTLLPNSSSLFSVPVIPVPTLAAGLPDELPTLTSGFEIPALVEVDPNAPDALPSLTALANGVPLLSSAAAGAPSDLPSTGAISDVVGAIPLATDPNLVGGISQLPSSTAWLTGLGKIEGLDTDGMFVYVLIDSGGGGAVDKIHKYTSSGTLVDAFDSDGIIDVTTSAGLDVEAAEAIAYAAGALWVAHDQQSVDDEGSGNQRVFLKFNATTGEAMATDCEPQFTNQWQQKVEAMTGNGGNDIFAQSLSDDQRIFRFNAANGCSRVGDWNPNYDRPYALGYDTTNDVIYSVNSTGEIRTHLPNQPQDTATNVGTVTGFTSTAPGGFLFDNGGLWSRGVMWIANGEGVTGGSTDGVIHMTQKGSTLSTSPRGLTYDSVNEHLYLLVNGPSSTNDWMVKLTTAGVQVGSAIDTGVDGAEGLTYLNGSVYVFYEDEHQNAMAKPWDVSGAAFGSAITLTTQWNGWGGEAFTSDGSTLFGYQGSSQAWGTWDTSGDTDESGECNNCTSVSNGAKAAAYRSSKGQYFLAKNDDIDMISALDGSQTTNSSTFASLTDGSSSLKIKGMTFVDDVLYMADDQNDQILKASIPTGETTNPVALTNDGTFLWAITNGTSGSDTLLKLNASTGAKVTGYALARDDAEGLAYHNSALWVLFSPSNGPCQIQQINPITGASVGSLTSIGDGGWCTGFGGMSSDGTNLWVHGKSGGSVYSYDTNGTQDAQKDNYEFGSGAHGVAYNTTTGQLWVAKGARIDAFDTSGTGGGGNSIDQVSGMNQIGLTVDNGTTSGNLSAKGMTWMGNVLYVVDTTTDHIYKTSAPVGSNDALGMTSDGTSLYILMNNSPTDSIMKVSASGSKVTAWATSGIASTTATAAKSIAVVGSELWVAELQDSMGSQWVFTSYSLADGSAGGSFNEHNVPWGNAQPNGMGSDGTYIYLGTSTGQMQKYDTSGNTVGQQAELQGMSNGVTALAVRSGSPRVLAVRNNDLKTFGLTGGSSLNTYSLTGVSVAGLATIGSVVYLADTNTNSVQKAAIPLPTTVITNQPKAMTTDGTDLFIVIEASPKDRIIKVNTEGILQSSFGTGGVATGPSDDVNGLALVGSTLYAAGSVQQQSCPPSCGNESGATIWSLNASTGATTETTSYNDVWGDFTGLTYDGTNLIATTDEGYGWQFQVISPNNLGGADKVGTMNTMGMSSPGSIVYAAGNNWVAQSSGSMLAAFTIGGWDANATSSFNLASATNINGMAYIDTTVYLADSVTNEVHGATFLANIPELTIAGTYGAQLLADFVGDDLEVATYTTASAAFTIARATSVDVAITAPADDSTVTVAVGVDSTVDANRKVTVTGTVDDPSVTSIILGAELASTTLFEDNADGNPDTSEALFTVTGTSASVGWHIDTNSFTSSGAGAWHYATDVQGSGTFDDGLANSGSLTIAEGVPIGDGGALSFHSWYNSEGYEGVDQKVLEVDIVGDDPDVGWQALRQIVDPFAMQYASNPQNAHASFAFIGQQPGDFGFSMGGGYDPGFQPCPPDCGGGPGSYQITGMSFNDPSWMTVNVPLTAFVGQTVNLRWRFDTVDSVFNNLEGWYIDNIIISGKGSGGGAETTPVTDGTFEATFTGLAEGENDVSVTAVIPYDDTITDVATITVKLDTLSPVTTITQDTVVATDTPDLITSELSYTVTGTFVETNYSKISAQNDIGAANAVPVFALGDEEEGTFSATANLFEGNNTITVTITDGAGRTGSDTVIIQRDTVGPTFTTLPTVYPVGSVSARPGDPIIFQLNAADAASDVKCVEVLFDPNSQVAPCTGGSPDEVEPFRKPAAIPPAVRDAWGTTGGWLLPVLVPDDALAGNYPLAIRIVDTGGTVTTTTLNAAITASLSAFNLALLPDENLVSIPLIPDDRADSNLPRLLDLNPTVRDLTDVIWHYDASLTNLPQEDRWTVYTPDGNSINDTLLDLKTGRGYWWNTDATKFTMSDPLRVGQPATPKPENFTYSGSSLVIGNEAPELYRTVPGWNLVGIHAEQEPQVSNYFAQHGRGDAALYSVIEFRKLITFPIGDQSAEPTFDLGFFSNLELTDTLRLGSGIWFNTPSAGTYAFSG